MRLGFGALLAALLAFAPLSFASAGDGPPIPPKPDFSSMQFLLGTWSCEHRDPVHPPYATQMTWSIDPTGYYLVSEGTRAPQTWFPEANHNRMMISYDPDRKQWSLVSTSDHGETASGVSDGWKDNVMSWHYFDAPPVVAGDPEMKLTKVSERAFTTGMDVTLTSGAHFSDTSSCTKAS